jgi:hypothetical protein
MNKWTKILWMMAAPKGHGDFEYLIVEADYDPELGLLTDL